MSEDGFIRFRTLAAAIVATVLLMIGINGASGNTDPIKTPEEPTKQADTRECPNTWLIAQADNENNRWFSTGIREIQDAKTTGEAEEAIDTWLRLVRRDPQLLSGTAKYFLDRDVDPSTLQDGKCASEEAETLTTELAAAIAESDVTPDEAPEDGYNSGADADGNVVAASDPGITGNRHAVKVVMKDGTVVWVMARCGNPVVKGKPPVPPGPTDEPPPDKEKPTTTTRPGDRTTTTIGRSTTTTIGSELDGAGPPTETFEVFSTKNPFTPLINPPSGGGAASGGATGGGTTGGGARTTVGGGTAGGGSTGATTQTTLRGGSGSGSGPGGTTTTQPGGSSGGQANEPRRQQRVALVDVLRRNGRLVAQVRVNDTVYTAAEGEVFAENYRVLSIDEANECGRFIFGDEQFRLCRGEETLK